MSDSKGGSGDRAGAAAGDAGPVELRSGSVRLYPSSRELFLDGQPVAIERRAFDLLLHLMRNAGRVVDKDELLREVWRGRPVSESALPQAVSRARRALGGGPDDWIVTVYGVGYRFGPAVRTANASTADADAAGAVETGPGTGPGTEYAADSGIESGAGSPGTRTSSSRSGRSRGSFRGHRALRYALLAVALVAVLAAAWVSVRPPAPSELRIAVLPVRNDSGDPRLDWVTLGLLPLIDRALDDENVQRIDLSRVVGTLRRYPEAQDDEAQARVLRLNGPVDRVVVPRLSVAENGYRLDLQTVDPADEPLELAVQGSDVAVLAVAAGTTLSETLGFRRGVSADRAPRRLVTDDPFVNEAFARGLDARWRSQWEDAASYLETVLAAAPDLLDARFQLALVKRRMGEWDEADQLHKALLEAARQRADLPLLAAVQQAAGTLAWRRGDREAAGAWYRQALDVFAERGTAADIAGVTANLGILAATRGDYEAAEGLMREALGHYEAAGDRFNEARTLKNLGKLLADGGRLDEGARYLLQSLELRQMLELPFEAALTLSDLGDIDMARGEWQRALAHYERALETAQDYDSPGFEARARADLSTVLRRLGRLEEARRMAAVAYRLATELGSASNQAYALLQQGRAEYDLGHWQRAGDLFEEARTLYEAVDQPLSEALARIAQAETLLEIGRLDAADAMLTTAADSLGGAARERIAPGLARARARLALARGDVDAALAAQREAYRRAVDRESLVERLDYGGGLGLLLLATGADPGEIEALAEALAPRAEASARALEFLQRFHLDRDPDQALALAERRRLLVGEGWTTEDRRELLTLRSRVER